MATDSIATILESIRGVDIFENEMLLVTGCGGSGKSVLLEDVLLREGFRKRWLAEILGAGAGRAASLPLIHHPLHTLGCIAAVSYREVLVTISQQTIAEALYLWEPLRQLAVGKTRGDLCPLCRGLLVRVSLSEWLEGWLEAHRDSVVFVGYSQRLPPERRQREEFLASLDRQGISRLLIDDAYEVRAESLAQSLDLGCSVQDVTVVIDRVRARVGQGRRILESVRNMELSGRASTLLVTLDPKVKIALPQSPEPYLCCDCNTLIEDSIVAPHSVSSEVVAEYSLGQLAKQLASALELPSDCRSPEAEFILDRAARAKQLGVDTVAIGTSVASLPQNIVEGLTLIAMVQPGVHGITYILDEPFLYSDIPAISRALSYLSDLVAERNTIVLATAAPEMAELVRLRATRTIELPSGNEVRTRRVNKHEDEVEGRQSLSSVGSVSDVVASSSSSPWEGRKLPVKQDPAKGEHEIVISGRQLWRARGETSLSTFLETLRVTRHIAKLLCRLPAAQVRACHDATLAKTIRGYVRLQSATGRLAISSEALQEYRVLDDLSWRGVSVRQLLLGQIGELLELFKFATWSRSIIVDLECLGLMTLPVWLPLAKMSYSELVKVTIWRAVRFQLRSGKESGASLVLDGVFRGLDSKDRQRIHTFLATSTDFGKVVTLGDSS